LKRISTLAFRASAAVAAVASPESYVIGGLNDGSERLGLPSRFIGTFGLTPAGRRGNSMTGVV
jgi:hypothetical protein